MHAELVQGATGRKADILYDKEYTLDLGGVCVRMVEVGPTHTRGDATLLVEGDDVLFAGDVVMNEAPDVCAGQRGRARGPRCL